ncbi:hypothetical protein EI42_06144 [Thermosporothrix hazakensis]|jgi:hypothetical protein|uniref:Uncharacterized protein n=2 Tax=Thermosporothrix TaxID=768650 RepID=A0A326TSN3_THEHA|nr:hypothetical protein [Thermosporothrix hazakensis]PZW19331.1 hypothetical protein EI42_06144 [Thermosporothrix hazakensis]BBH90028.1 hypothetical protein KTC_47790 [Thermosporothrix sp. COM3]GCE48231.1 hypothetical protein KTH_31000 [Thermosporothrix hazakensis]
MQKQKTKPEKTQAVQPTAAESKAIEKPRFTFPAWPTSRPGPTKTPPPPGMKPVNAIRREQVTEVGYNQVTGTPSVESAERPVADEAKVGSVSPDLEKNSPYVHKKPKKRL